ncbi:hypothetical protein R3W88_016510 [Solanum pinnatisectum]|uniref:Uncharacterized protein n=1 Tax=Solanum pinnatisectum TaxID=50273 RepID=A0AAV9KYQ8_9SOLN|nr:hypothetical protein R3W88_016510 [Solanum pinnatisectum]
MDLREGTSHSPPDQRDRFLSEEHSESLVPLVSASPAPVESRRDVVPLASPVPLVPAEARDTGSSVPIVPPPETGEQGMREAPSGSTTCSSPLVRAPRPGPQSTQSRGRERAGGDTLGLSGGQNRFYALTGQQDLEASPDLVTSIRGLVPTMLMSLIKAIVDTIFWISFSMFQSLAHRLGMYIYMCVSRYVFSCGLVG